MASAGGASSGTSSMQHNSSSEEDMNMKTMDERKRKRMQSNRESARRSRMRKQRHLDDLMSQIESLRKVNEQMLSNINVTTQKYIGIESQNSILRAQMDELSHRLESLNEINNVLRGTNDGEQCLGVFDQEFLPINQGYFGNDFNGFLVNNSNNPWNCINQPIMASAHMFEY